MTDVSLAMMYRKKPVEVAAACWNGSVGWATPIIDWILENGGTARFHDAVTPEDDHSIVIDTLEGSMTASLGDFIIRGVQGEFYPCKPDIFEATYERV
jgi:hypothetical protein